MDTISSFLEAALGLSATRPEQLSVLQTCDRAVVVFVMLIVYVRFGKKRFLGQATAFDAILVIIIGSIASRAISGTAPFVASLAATLVLILVHWVISFAARDSKTLSFLTKGRATLIVEDGRVDRQAMRRAHMSDDDLAEDLRLQGVNDPKNVEEARLERSGRLSVVENK